MFRAAKSLKASGINIIYFASAQNNAGKAVFFSHKIFFFANNFSF
jgi:hypothetical protein